MVSWHQLLWESRGNPAHSRSSQWVVMGVSGTAGGGGDAYPLPSQDALLQQQRQQHTPSLTRELRFLPP